jgi:ABC-type branched-subunit amino acid transport system ATPase component
VSETVLAVENVSRSFGGLQAVDHCSFQVQRGRITGLIGPNGAGKTTMLNLIAGELRPDEGRILFDGKDIGGKLPHEVSRNGVARTFQLARELGQLTVMENLLMAPYPQIGEGFFQALWQGRAVRRQERVLKERARQLLDLVGLFSLRNDLAVSLSGGQKKLLELARVMMTRPELLLMDEPAAGVNPALMERLLGYIRLLRDEMGVTVLIIEHNLGIIESLCEDVIVMAIGKVLARGPMSELRQNAEVIEAYLGEGRAHGVI